MAAHLCDSSVCPSPTLSCDSADDPHGSCREFGAVFFEPAGDIQDG